MQSNLSERMLLVIVSLIAGAAICALFMPRPTVAATSGAGGFSQLQGPTNVLIQFMDDKPVTESAWYSGSVKGYDGNMVIFANEATPDEVIYMPLANIRQIQIKK